VTIKDKEKKGGEAVQNKRDEDEKERRCGAGGRFIFKVREKAKKG